MNKLLFIMLMLLTNSCTQTKEIQFGTYNNVQLGGLYGETFDIKADSTFTFRTTTCMTSTLARGKVRKQKSKFYLYDIENLSKPIFLDSIVKRDTQYLNFPNGKREVVFPSKVAYRYYGNEKLSDRVPSSVAMKRKYLYMFDNNNKASGTLKLLKKKQ